MDIRGASGRENSSTLGCDLIPDRCRGGGLRWCFVANVRQLPLEFTRRRRLPLTRSECEDGERPCPYARCKYHIGETPSGETCTLDLTKRGGMSLDEIAGVFGLKSKETIRLVEAKAINKILIAALGAEPSKAIRSMLEHVEPGWRMADRSAGPPPRSNVRRMRLPDASEDLDEATPEPDRADLLTEHVWAAYLRDSSNRQRERHAAEIREVEEDDSLQHPHRDPSWPPAEPGSGDRLLEGAQEPQGQVIAMAFYLGVSFDEVG